MQISGTQITYVHTRIVSGKFLGRNRVRNIEISIHILFTLFLISYVHTTFALTGVPYRGP